MINKEEIIIDAVLRKEIIAIICTDPRGYSTQFQETLVKFIMECFNFKIRPSVIIEYVNKDFGFVIDKADLIKIATHCIKIDLEKFVDGTYENLMSSVSAKWLYHVSTKIYPFELVGDFCWNHPYISGTILLVVCLGIYIYMISPDYEDSKSTDSESSKSTNNTSD